MKFKKISYLTLGLVLILNLFAFNASAAEFMINKDGGNITVDQNEKVKNLYTVGNMISINGDIEKTLRAAGNIVTVNGDVEGNVCAGGGTVIIRGKVGDSVHAGAGTILIESEITEDLIIAGGNITIAKSASIGGDLIVGGGTVDIQGSVAGDILLGGGQATINSRIGGKVDATVDELTLGEQAEIIGDLKYKSPKEAEIKEGAKVLGEVDYTQRLGKKSWTKDPKLLIGILTLGFLIKILSVIAVGLILIYFLRKFTKQVIRESLTNFWSNLGRGFATLILAPVACIILLITVIGIWLVGLIIPAYILLIALSSALASIAFGSWLIKVIKKQEKYMINWPAVVVGVIGLKIVIFIPYIGWLVGLIFMLISLGALARISFQGLISRK